VLCASNPKPTKVKGLAASASIFISNWLRAVRVKQLSQYTVMGRALSIQSEIAKKISIPKDTIALDLYLQCKVLEYGVDVVYNDNAVVYLAVCFQRSTSERNLWYNNKSAAKIFQIQ
jgi:hypothetical protein